MLVHAVAAPMIHATEALEYGLDGFRSVIEERRRYETPVEEQEALALLEPGDHAGQEAAIAELDQLPVDVVYLEVIAADGDRLQVFLGTGPAEIVHGVEGVGFAAFLRRGGEQFLPRRSVLLIAENGDRSVGDVIVRIVDELHERVEAGLVVAPA
jgi:hypothetical protein